MTGPAETPLSPARTDDSDLGYAPRYHDPTENEAEDNDEPLAYKLRYNSVYTLDVGSSDVAALSGRETFPDGVGLGDALPAEGNVEPCAAVPAPSACDAAKPSDEEEESIASVATLTRKASMSTRCAAEAAAALAARTAAFSERISSGLSSQSVDLALQMLEKEAAAAGAGALEVEPIGTRESPVNTDVHSGTKLYPDEATLVPPVVQQEDAQQQLRYAEGVGQVQEQAALDVAGGLSQPEPSQEEGLPDQSAAHYQAAPAVQSFPHENWTDAEGGEAGLCPAALAAGSVDAHGDQLPGGDKAAGGGELPEEAALTSIENPMHLSAAAPGYTDDELQSDAPAQSQHQQQPWADDSAVAYPQTTSFSDGALDAITAAVLSVQSEEEAPTAEADEAALPEPFLAGIPDAHTVDTQLPEAITAPSTNYTSASYYAEPDTDSSPGTEQPQAEKPDGAATAAVGFAETYTEAETEEGAPVVVWSSTVADSEPATDVPLAAATSAAAADAVPPVYVDPAVGLASAMGSSETASTQLLLDDYRIAAAAGLVSPELASLLGLAPPLAGADSGAVGATEAAVEGAQGELVQDVDGEDDEEEDEVEVVQTAVWNGCVEEEEEVAVRVAPRVPSGVVEHPPLGYMDSGEAVVNLISGGGGAGLDATSPSPFSAAREVGTLALGSQQQAAPRPEEGGFVVESLSSGVAALERGQPDGSQAVPQQVPQYEQQQEPPRQLVGPASSGGATAAAVVPQAPPPAAPGASGGMVTAAALAGGAGLVAMAGAALGAGVVIERQADAAADHHAGPQPSRAPPAMTMAPHEMPPQQQLQQSWRGPAPGAASVAGVPLGGPYTGAPQPPPPSLPHPVGNMPPPSQPFQPHPGQRLLPHQASGQATPRSPDGPLLPTSMRPSASPVTGPSGVRPMMPHQPAGPGMLPPGFVPAHLGPGAAGPGVRLPYPVGGSSVGGPGGPGPAMRPGAPSGQVMPMPPPNGAGGAPPFGLHPLPQQHMPGGPALPPGARLQGPPLPGSPGHPQRGMVSPPQQLGPGPWGPVQGPGQGPQPSPAFGMGGPGSGPAVRPGVPGAAGMMHGPGGPQPQNRPPGMPGPRPPLGPGGPPPPPQPPSPYPGLLYTEGRDTLGRPVVVLNTAMLPKKAKKEEVLAYLLQQLQPVVQREYVLVVLSLAMGVKAGSVSSTWALGAYRSLAKPYRKNVKHIVLVQPSAWARALLALAQPFVSKKAAHKVKKVENLVQVAEATGGEVRLESLGACFVREIQYGLGAPPLAGLLPPGMPAGPGPSQQRPPFAGAANGNGAAPPPQRPGMPMRMAPGAGAGPQRPPMQMWPPGSMQAMPMQPGGPGAGAGPRGPYPAGPPVQQQPFPRPMTGSNMPTPVYGPGGPGPATASRIQGPPPPMPQFPAGPVGQADGSMQQGAAAGGSVTPPPVARQGSVVRGPAQGQGM